MALTFPGLGGILSGLNNAPGYSKRQTREAEQQRALQELQQRQGVHKDTHQLERDKFEWSKRQQKGTPAQRMLEQQQTEAQRLANQRSRWENKMVGQQAMKALGPGMSATQGGQGGQGQSSSPRTLGRNLPLSSGPTTNTAPRPTTLGLPQGASERSQPVNPGWGARNVLTPQAAQTAPGDGPTSQRLAQGRAARSQGGARGGGGGGGAAPSRKSSSAPMGEKYGRRTGAGPPPGLAALGGGAKPSLGALARRRPGAAAPTWTPKPSTPGQATRRASPMLPNPVLKGGSWNAKPWAGDVYSRNNRPSDLAAVGTVGDLAGRTGTINVHSSRERAGRSNTLGYNSRGESTTSSGPGPRRQSRNSSGRGKG